VSGADIQVGFLTRNQEALVLSARAFPNSLSNISISHVSVIQVSGTGAVQERHKKRYRSGT